MPLIPRESHRGGDWRMKASEGGHGLSPGIQGWVLPRWLVRRASCTVPVAPGRRGQAHTENSEFRQPSWSCQALSIKSLRSDQFHLAPKSLIGETPQLERSLLLWHHNWGGGFAANEESSDSSDRSRKPLLSGASRD